MMTTDHAVQFFCLAPFVQNCLSPRYFFVPSVPKAVKDSLKGKERGRLTFQLSACSNQGGRRRICNRMTKVSSRQFPAKAPPSASLIGVSCRLPSCRLRLKNYASPGCNLTKAYGALYSLRRRPEGNGPLPDHNGHNPNSVGPASCRLIPPRAPSAQHAHTSPP